MGTNFVLFDESNEEVYIFSENGDLLWKTADFLLGTYRRFDGSNEKNSYLVSINDGKNRYDAIFNFDTLSVIKTYSGKLGLEGKKIVLSQKTFVTHDRTKIALFNHSNEAIWHHKFSDLIQADDAFLNSELIEVGGKLYFTLNSQKGGDPGIICLDVQSGELIRHFAGTFFGVFKDNDFVFSSKYENILCRIDSRTNEIENWDVGQLLKENNFKSINDHRCAAQDGKFYFTQTFGDHNAKLGILNFDTKIMDYNYDFEVSNGAIGSIKLGKDRIFVHTQDHTLHIFEE
ncbi:MAG: hypothetical protein KDC80_23800 [Saprospiraceae bacterium]|nr:hypothetical protein [Saprospiraceae bacterium]